MKPTKNRVFCNECHRIKMVFETQKKADSFLKFNADEIEQETGVKPERSYFCIACNGWHVTHLSNPILGKTPTEIALEKSAKIKEQKEAYKEKLKYEKCNIRIAKAQEKFKELDVKNIEELALIHKKIESILKANLDNQQYAIVFDMKNAVEKYIADCIK